jgi:2-dehydro-3-deoxyphosphogluconate aldolase / (4S)-4-hydroxy-2-oxoglutarate aldolase
MNSEKCLGKIAAAGLIAVIRADNEKEALSIVAALEEGGAVIIEVTMTVPGAVEVIEKLVKDGSETVTIGAGTVMSVETARAVISAGAQFIVSPHLNTDLIQFCNDSGVLYTPGAMTPTEIVTAVESGAPAVKIFPGNVLGPGFIKAVRGPMPGVRLIPTGGVSLDNVEQWIKSGAYAVGVGGELTRSSKSGDFAQITELAREFIEKIDLARKRINSGE